MTYSFQPVTVTTSSGMRHEPVLCEIIDGKVDVYDRAGGLLAHAVMRPNAIITGRRRRLLDTVDGEWIVEDICGCSSAKRELLRQWRKGPVSA